MHTLQTGPNHVTQLEAFIPRARYISCW